MRKFKFRAWDKISQKIIYGIACCGDSWNEILENGGVGMQFTGAYAEDGKEIFEGDIVQTCFKHPYVVKWDARGCAFNIPPFTNESWGMGESPTYVKHTYKILGNIYEHPELLKSFNHNSAYTSPDSAKS